MNVSFQKIFIALAVQLLLAPKLPAQLSTATVSGSVRDASGASIPGASIELTNTGTGIARQTASNDSGIYTFLGIQPGSYTLQASATGMAPQRLSAFTLQVNQTATLDFDLKPGDVTQSVTVSGSAAEVQSSTAELGTVVSQKAVADLPLNGRNFSQLLALTPGVSPVSVSQNATGPLRSVGTVVMPSVNGQTGRSNIFLLDGVVNFGANQNYYIVTPIVETIQEFKVQAHNDQAEFGGGLGGVVNVVTKAGTNELHGSGWWFVRNDAFDARSFFQPAVTPFRWNQYGGSVGGPVTIPKLYSGKNRTFFLLGYQGYKLRRPNQSFFRVPTAANLNGDLSDWPRQIFNPLTTRQDPARPGTFLRDPFPGNRIPATMLDAGALLYARTTLPTPIATGVADRNAQDDTPFSQNQEEYHARVDHTFSERDLAWFRWSGRLSSVSTSAGRPTLPTNNPTSSRNIGAAWVHTFNAATVLQLQFGHSRQFDEIITRFRGLPDNFVASAGFSEALARNYELTRELVPGLNVADFFGGGENLQPSDSWNYQYRGDLSRNVGRHSLKFGVDWVRSGVYIVPNTATVSFIATQTSNPAAAATTGSALASFLLGFPDNAQRRNTIISRSARNLFGLYVQDQWRATNKLTVNIGLRYDRAAWPRFGRPEDRNQEVGLMDFNRGVYLLQQSVPSCAERGKAPCIPTAGGALPANVVVLPDGQLRKNNNLNLQPRFGLAYRLRPSTSLRASFGVSFDSWAGIEQISTNVQGSWPSLAQQLVSNLNRSDAPPTVTFKNPFAGAASGLTPEATPFTRNQFWADPLWKNPYSLQWTLGMQHQLVDGTVLSLHYVGSGSKRLDIGGLYNVAMTPGPGNPRDRSPFPYINAMNYDRSNGRGTYHGLQVGLNRRASRGLTYLVSYTWSKSIDTGCSGWFGVEGCSVQNPYDLNADRSVSATDLTHNFTTSWVYELPFGKGRLSTHNHALDLLASGWQLNGILSLRSGRVYTPTASGDIANTGNNEYMRLNVVGNHKLENPQPEAWFNRSAFASPAQFTFGNAGRHSLRSDGLENLDASIFRQFRVRENFSMELRGEAFNLLNHTVFGLPTSNITSPNFGRVLTLGNSPRQLQLGLRLIF